jgi:excisionase family DNA binding protein
MSPGMNRNDASAVGQSEQQRLAFSVDEVAAALGISRDLVYDLLRTGQLRSVKAGRRRLISRQHIEDFLAR